METTRRWILLLGILYASCQWRGAGIPEQTTPSAQLYMKRCSFCHRLPHPGRHGSAVWEGMITVLDKGIMPVFSEEEKAAVLEHLRSGKGEKLYALRCSKCHTLPDRERLSPDEWREKIVVLGHNEMPVYSNEERELILSYLRRHSR